MRSSRSFPPCVRVISAGEHHAAEVAIAPERGFAEHIAQHGIVDPGVHFLDFVLRVDLADVFVLSEHESHFGAAIVGWRGCRMVRRGGSQEALRGRPDLHGARLDVFRVRHRGHGQAGGGTAGPSYGPGNISDHVLLRPRFVRREAEAGGIDGLLARHLHAAAGAEVVNRRDVAAHIEFRRRQRRTWLLPNLEPLTGPGALDRRDVIGPERLNGRIQCARLLTASRESGGRSRRQY